MDKEGLKLLVSNSIKKNKFIPLSQISELNSVSHVILEMDRDNNEYYYKIDLNELIDKEFNTDIITDNGWKLSSDEKFIILTL